MGAEGGIVEFCEGDVLVVCVLNVRGKSLGILGLWVHLPTFSRDADRTFHHSHACESLAVSKSNGMQFIHANAIFSMCVCVYVQYAYELPHYMQRIARDEGTYSEGTALQHYNHASLRMNICAVLSAHI